MTGTEAPEAVTHIVVTADGERMTVEAFAELAGKKPAKWYPPAPVKVSRTKATATVRTGDRYRKRSFASQDERRDQTAALAVELGLWQPRPDEPMVTALREAAPNELAAIWGRLPAVRWLTRELCDHPIAWRAAGVAHADDLRPDMMS